MQTGPQPVFAQPAQTGNSSDSCISPPVIAVFQEDIFVAFFHLGIKSVVSSKMRVMVSLRFFDSRNFFRQLF